MTKETKELLAALLADRLRGHLTGGPGAARTVSPAGATARWSSVSADKQEAYLKLAKDIPEILGVVARVENEKSPG